VGCTWAGFVAAALPWAHKAEALRAIHGAERSKSWRRFMGDLQGVWVKDAA
jgi:hypothetical protein